MSNSSRANPVSPRDKMPPGRMNCAVLIRMSVLPPISPAILRTDASSVTSMGKISTPKSFRTAILGWGRQFSGSPAKISDAPAFNRACANAGACGLLASVRKIRRCFGLADNSRIIGSSSMLGVACSGSATNTPCPARSRRCSTCTLACFVTSGCTCARITGPASSLMVPVRQGRRSRKNNRGEAWIVVSAIN